MIVRLLALALLAGPVAAQDSKPAQDADGELPKRVRSILLYNGDACPPAEDPDEIVVCATTGESPYRIPKALRDKPKETAGGRAWTDRMETVEEINRSGLPNSCSPVGTGGQTGCTRQMLRQWYQERLEAKAKAARAQ
jgi:hypothetical protein